MELTLMLFLFQLAAVAVSSRCTTGRIYFGNLGMSSAELIVFNGIYVQQQNDPASDSGLAMPIYKHESREQFLHAVFVDDLLHWRIGIRVVGGQTDFVDYLSASSVDADNFTSPDMTSRWHVWNTGNHTWSLARRLRATCVESDFITCTSGLLNVSGLSQRHQRWHKMRMGTYRITSLTNQLRPVYKHHIRDDYLFFVDKWWFIGTEVGNKSGAMFVRDGAWRPEHVLANWQVFIRSHFESDSGLRVRCQGSTTATVTDDQDYNNGIVLPTSAVAIEELIESNELGEGAVSTAYQAHSDDDDEHENSDDEDDRLCGTNLCEAGRGRCQQTMDGPLCVCVDGYFGPDCQQQIECGVPAQCSTSRLVAQTGRSFLDVAIYQCVTEGTPAVTGTVCQLNGTWSRATAECVEQISFITPEHPYVPISRH